MSTAELITIIGAIVAVVVAFAMGHQAGLTAAAHAPAPEPHGLEPMDDAVAGDWADEAYPIMVYKADAAWVAEHTTARGYHRMTSGESAGAAADGMARRLATEYQPDAVPVVGFVSGCPGIQRFVQALHDAGFLVIEAEPHTESRPARVVVRIHDERIARVELIRLEVIIGIAISQSDLRFIATLSRAERGVSVVIEGVDDSRLKGGVM